MAEADQASSSESSSSSIPEKKITKKHRQIQVEKGNGVRLSQLDWKEADVRAIVGAEVESGFCAKTRFCVEGAFGYDGYTGYKWSHMSLRKNGAN